MKINEIQKLASLMSEHELAEISIESEDMKLTLKRGGQESVQVPAPPAAPAPTPAPAPAQPSGAEVQPSQAEETAGGPAADSVDTINSPIVGTFYSAPSPDAKPYVQPGDKVTEDTVVCIVEAMKVMNEVKAEKSGTIKKVLVDNTSAVEYNQPLFEIELD